MLKLVTVFLGCVHAIPGADAEFFFGPSPAIRGRSFGPREALLRVMRGPHPLPPSAWGAMFKHEE
jgi:hypothetical protein